MASQQVMGIRPDGHVLDGAGHYPGFNAHGTSLMLITKEEITMKNSNQTQVAGFINEGNPNTQEEPVIKIGQPSPGIVSDQQSAQVVQQAIIDDQSLSDDIRVTVKDGEVTLDGEVATEQLRDLATNTATALGAVDQVNNRIEITEGATK
jgi:osmotically-inducible protein OsmY